MENKKSNTPKKTTSAKKNTKTELTTSVVKASGKASQKTVRKTTDKAPHKTGTKPAVKASGRDKAAPSSEPLPEKRKSPRPRYDHIDELVGIILIALGIVSGILTYTNSNAVFKAVVGFLCGLVGILQYAIPVLLCAFGIILIFVPKRQVGTGAIIMLSGSMFCIDCIAHLFTFPVSGIAFGDFLSDAFNFGKEGQGGGLLSAIPSYALSQLVTVSGAIVIFIAAALVLLLLATRVSLRSAGMKIVAKMDAIEDRRKARVYAEKLEYDSYYGTDKGINNVHTPHAKIGSSEQTSSASPDAANITPDDPLPAMQGVFSDYADEDLKIGEDGDRLRGSFKGHKRGSMNMTVELSDLDSVINNAVDTESGLDVLPASGAIPYEYRMHGSASGRTSAPSKPAITEYDPYETIEIIPDESLSSLDEDEPDAPKASDTATDAPAKPAVESSKKASGDNDDEPDGLEAPPAVQVYQKPPISLLRLPDRSESIANDSPSEKARLLIETLASFNISAKVINISVGPVITRFEIQPAQGIRVNRITSLSNDIALALAAPRVRIEAPIPGKAAIGIEIPNKDTAMVRLREVLDTREFATASSPLTFALGKDIAGKPVYANLEKMPHMLIAGATGSGKSVCINSIILSTLYKSSPDEVRMILIDPKVVELSIFAPVPHLYCPVVTDPKKAAGVLKWACNEMDQRYSKMSKVNARDLARFNSLQTEPENRMPRLMIIIDELADLMIVSAKDVEESIARLAQLGRACGIHLIVATQRPSVDVITGLIKTNIPSRIAFAVSSAIDSRVILDGSGAEKLLGHGDMLFHPNGAAKPTRAQGAYVSDEEVENIMQFFVDHQIEVPQNNNVLDAIPDLTAPTGQGNGKQEDELLPDAVRIVMDSGSASISMIQRRLRVGYARAARLVDIMEQMKLVSGFDGSKPRKVLIDEAGYRELFGDNSII